MVKTDSHQGKGDVTRQTLSLVRPHSGVGARGWSLDTGGHLAPVAWSLSALRWGKWIVSTLRPDQPPPHYTETLNVF